MFNARNNILVNSQSFKKDDVKSISALYQGDNIYIYPSKNQDIILEEYMESENPEKFALTTLLDGNLEIKSGYRNYNFLIEGWDKHNYVFLYLPDDWSGELGIETSSGEIKADNNDKALEIPNYNIFTKSFLAKSISGSISLADVLVKSNLTLETNSGNIKALSLKSENLLVKTISGGFLANYISSKSSTIHASSGSVKCSEEIDGENIEINTSSGGIYLNTAKGNSITLAATSGSIRIYEEIIGNNLNLSTSSGSIKADKFTGAYNIFTTSGAVKIEKLKGFGAMESKSGSIFVEDFVSLDGDTKFFASSGSIKMSMEKSQVYYAHLKSEHGSISTYFNNQKSNAFSDMVGHNPKHNLYAETKTGSIVIK